MSNLADDEYRTAFAERRQRLLLAAGRNEEALLAFNERLAADSKNIELLLEGITLANAIGMNIQAREWNEKVLELTPHDLDALNRQVNYSLAVGDLPGALTWSRKMVDNLSLIHI